MLWKPDIPSSSSIMTLQVRDNVRRARVRIEPPGNGGVVAPNLIVLGTNRSRERVGIRICRWPFGIHVVVYVQVVEVDPTEGGSAEGIDNIFDTMCLLPPNRHLPIAAPGYFNW